ncbi:autotransporter assembly complex protein TamA [Candidatus Finniella inopinata]|uniref:Outer membrane protein assembly factor n=1 Tax=Candidatus Finniella inopinata TaxID=1696036 RepID=A0A4Q7DI90_9PROT|nr:BamA/TamA family outer membrane protein [Candidatus Finniella inopinata]RZI45805.1 hypothetical protein EQU50_05055 [Candidatus Finniella inopinata]
MQQLFLVLITLALGLLLTGCRWFDENFGGDVQALDVHTQGIGYQTLWADPIDGEIKAILEKASILMKLEHRPPISLAGLIKRCKMDQDSFKKGLASIGYFKGKIEFHIDDKKDPFQVTIKVTPGLRYRLGSIKVESPGQPQIISMLTTAALEDITQTKMGDIVDLEKVLKGTQRLKKYLQTMGYPFADVEEPEGRVDDAKQTVEVIYTINPQALARIESTHIDGLNNLEESYIQNRVIWKEGEVFDQGKVDKTRRKLLETGLLSSVTITPEKKGNPKDGYQPLTMLVKTSEGAARAVGVGAKFSTSEGIGGHLFWYHNNLARHGQQLGASFQSSKRETKAKLSYDIPDFGKPLQTLKNTAFLLREITRAYTGRTYSVGSSLQHPFNDHFKGAIGLEVEGGRIKRQTVIYRTRLLGIPGELKADFTDDLLDPTRGMKAELKVTPYYGRMGNKNGMVVGSTALSAYLPFATNEIGESRFVWASFVKGGSIFNQPLQAIPPNKRFYAGGSGSVRGYGYQLAGPLDGQSIPEGGRSLIEVGTELRFRTTETTGFVTFVEGCSVETDRIPSLSKGALWGAGVGFRYYSPLGPIRADIAVPMERRKDTSGKRIDAPFQIYLSVGQAF